MLIQLPEIVPFSALASSMSVIGKVILLAKAGFALYGGKFRSGTVTAGQRRAFSTCIPQ